MLPRFSFFMCCCLFLLCLAAAPAKQAPEPAPAAIRQEQTLTYTEEIPFSTQYEDTPLLPQGQEIVITAGVPGQLCRTVSVLYEDGTEVCRTTLEETVLQSPTAQYVLRGTCREPDYIRTQPIIADSYIITPEGKLLTYSHSQQFLATAYTHTDAGCDTITATGTTVRTGVVAVDPELIPYFTKMYIVTNDGAYIYGESQAEDCGGDINGNRLDLYFATTGDALRFGVRECTVYFLS